ncbi:MAG: M20 family metallopeptidase [Candidatus Omnitrophota bacterium]|jgi:acetylornithine deacetylase/succinyl-diaminopimelate desuccinylase family protein
MVNKVRLIKLTRKLIQINSENPPGDESVLANFVQGYLKGLGLRAKIYEFKRNRSNVLAYLEKPGNRRQLLITPHLDTVCAGENWRFNPFAAKIAGNRIYGLGATDCKANLAVALEAINSLVEDKKCLDYNLVLAATADEECGSGLGLIPLLDKKILKPDAALVLDADDFEIIVAQKGLMHLKIRIEGKRAHGAYPYLGVNAIDIALDVIKDIKNHKFHYSKNKYLKAPTLNVGTIHGGDKVNIVADRCEFELDFRFLPGTKPEEILDVLKKILHKRAKKYKIEESSIQQTYSISERHPLVSVLKEAMRDFGVRPHLTGSEGATVITFFQHKNIPAIASGFGCFGCAHISDEYVKIDNLYKGAKVLERFLANYKF